MRASLWLFLLVPVSAASIFLLLDYAKALPGPTEALHVERAAMAAGAEFRAADAVSVALPHDWRDMDDVPSEVWYRIEVPLQVPPNRLWGVLIPNIEQNAQIFLNDAIAGGYGSMAAYPSRYSNQALYFPLANGLLKPGINELRVRVKSYPPGRGHLGKVYLGPDTVLRPYYQRLVFVKSDLLWFFVAASLGMTLVILALIWQRPDDALYRWFGAQIGFWTLASGMSALVDTPLSAPWHLALTTICSTWFCAASFAFAFRVVGDRHAGLERLYLSCAVLGTVAVLVIALIAPERVYQLSPFSTIVQMVLGPFVIAWLVRSYFHSRDPEVFLLLYAAGILVVFGFFSMSESTGLRSGVEGRYLFYATPLFLAAFVFLLLRRFIAALHEAEDLNRNLEVRAEQKNRELEENYARIRHMEQEQTLAVERERIMRDMHDGVGGLLVSTMRRIQANGDERVADSGIADTLDNALTDLRLMIDSLEIGEEDLDVALGMLRRRLQTQLEDTGVAVNWRVDALPAIPGMTPHAVLQIMRILQEGIANALRHASPTTLSLRAYNGDGQVIIELEDDGTGLPETPQKGQGINNMQRRARDIGGRLSLDSGAAGTRLSLALSTQPSRADG